jgi:hypothetical protein
MQSSVAVTYPLLLMAVDRAFEADSAPRAIRFAAIAVLLCLAGGFPHWILFGAAAASLYFFFRLAAARGTRGLRAAARLAAGVAIAAAVLLPAILATARFLRASDYASLRRGMGGGYALPLRHLRLYALPDYYGTPRRDDYRGVGWIPGDNYVEVSSGVGVAACGLAFLGVAAVRRRREAAYAAALGLAVAAPLYLGGALLERVGSLPLLDIGLFARAKILVVFAAAILAACGVESLERVAVPATLQRAAIQALPFLVAVPLGFLALDFYPVCRPEEAVFADTPGIRALRERGTGGGRFAAAGWTLIPNVSEAIGLDDVRGHFMTDAPYRRLLEAAGPGPFGRFGTYLVLDPATLDTDAPVLDLLGVRTLAAPPGARSPVGDDVESRDAAPFAPEEGAGADGPGRRRAETSLRLVYDGPDMTLFERAGAFSRFWLVGGATPGGVAETAAATRETLAATVFLPSDDAARLAHPGSPGGLGEARVVALAPERFAVETTTAAPAILVSTQKRFAPYWRVFVDGAAAEALAADGPFLAAAVPPGRHLVEGRFVVPRLEIAVSGAGVLTLLAVLAAAARARRVTGSPGT